MRIHNYKIEFEFELDFPRADPCRANVSVDDLSSDKKRVTRRRRSSVCYFMGWRSNRLHAMLATSKFSELPYGLWSTLGKEQSAVSTLLPHCVYRSQYCSKLLALPVHELMSAQSFSEALAPTAVYWPPAGPTKPPA